MKLKGLAGLVLGLSLTTSVNAGEVKDSYLEVRATPKMGLSTPSRPHVWTVYAEIKGVESEKFYCPKVVWIAGNGINEVRAEQESDCVPFEQRNQPIYNQDKKCNAYIKGGEFFNPRETNPECFTKEPQGYPKFWSRKYSASIPGEYQVCVQLEKSGRVIAKKCAKSTIPGGDNYGERPGFGENY